jgi:hypothetical protein
MKLRVGTHQFHGKIQGGTVTQKHLQRRYTSSRKIDGTLFPRLVSPGTQMEASPLGDTPPPKKGESLLGRSEDDGTTTPLPLDEAPSPLSEAGGLAGVPGGTLILHPTDGVFQVSR